ERIPDRVFAGEDRSREPLGISSRAVQGRLCRLSPAPRGDLNATNTTDLETKGKIPAKTLPAETLPIRSEALPTEGSASDAIGSVPKGSVLNGKERNENNAVALVAFPKGGPSTAVEACRQCGGGPEGRKLEQLAWDGGLVSLHQGC